MKIAVMGVGGVGGYYGSLIARHYAEDRDVEIIFIARGRHLEAIRTNGLKMLSQEGEFTARPALATDNPVECGPVDILLLCTKGYDLEDSARLVSPCVDENTVVISLLNGVNNPERLRTVLHKGKILNGCVYVAAHILRPGVIQQAGGSGKLFFGGKPDLPVDGKGIEKTLRAADIDAEYSRDIESIVWEKYIFISPFATATTFLDRTIRGVLDDGEGKTLLEGLLGEVIQIAESRGVRLPENIRKTTIDMTSSFPYETKTSMQKDVEDGKRTEIDTFTGYIVKTAKKHGISVPHHDRIYKALEMRLQT
jgi:2-dehydropantoate 2-reductase